MLWKIELTLASDFGSPPSRGQALDFGFVRSRIRAKGMGEALVRSDVCLCRSAHDREQLSLEDVLPGYPVGAGYDAVIEG